MTNVLGYTVTHRVGASVHASHIGSGDDFAAARDVLVGNLALRLARFSKFCTGGTHVPACDCSVLRNAISTAQNMNGPGSVTANDGVILAIKPVVL
ncbi:hypothetical protein [Streptomyces sp. TR02-1]|uniref:hypothetical protein n=1 Tax=Streptomyces sp. TR02-1 TaxID=3385977 RepID=UPI0039A0C02D